MKLIKFLWGGVMLDYLFVLILIKYLKLKFDKDFYLERVYLIG